MNTGAWDEEIQLAITIVIEVVAIVAAVAATVYAGGPASGAAAYATVKQLGNNAAGRQDGWNWGQFAYDAVSYYATAGTGGAATGAKQIAIQAAKTATTKALVDHGFSKATGGKYGREFTWENYLTSFATSAATTAVSSQFEASKGADAFEIAGKRLGNQVANGLVSDAIRRNTYGSYDADKETGLNFLERTLQSTATSFANDLGEATAKSSLQFYYGEEAGAKRYDNIKAQQKLDAQKPDWIDSTLDFLGIVDLPAHTQPPKNVLAAEQQDNERLRANAGLLDLTNSQASAYGIQPGAMVDVGAGNILGGIDGTTFDDMRERSQGVNPLEQEGFVYAQSLEDGIESGDVLVLGFNETEAVINTEALFEGDITSQEYEYGFANYEKINEETVESDLFNLDVANGFSDNNEINQFTQLYGDIRDELTDYGNYASVSSDEAVDGVGDGLSAIANEVNEIIESAKKPFTIIGNELSGYGEELSDGLKRDFSGLASSIENNQQTANDFYKGVKVDAANDGSLPKYLAAPFGQSFGNFGYNIVGFGANLLGDQTRAAEQWNNFSEYSLEASEGTNALELEAGIGVNFFGNQVSIGLAFGADNQGRVDIALGFNH